MTGEAPYKFESISLQRGVVQTIGSSAVEPYIAGKSRAPWCRDADVKPSRPYPARGKAEFHDALWRANPRAFPHRAVALAVRPFGVLFGKRGTRKTMIVALARKLIIALWRFVTTGEPLELSLIHI